MTNSFYDNQIKNRNFLSPSGFQFNLARAPKVDFFSNSTRIPGIQLGNIDVGNYLKSIPVPGDQIQFEDLTLQFLVDENMENYLEIHNWIYSLGYPKSVDQFGDLIRADDNQFVIDNLRQFSDGTLTVLNSNFVPMSYIIFKDLFPESLSTLLDNKVNGSSHQSNSSRTSSVFNQYSSVFFKLLFTNIFLIICFK